MSVPGPLAESTSKRTSTFLIHFVSASTFRNHCLHTYKSYIHLNIYFSHPPHSDLSPTSILHINLIHIQPPTSTHPHSAPPIIHLSTFSPPHPTRPHPTPPTIHLSTFSPHIHPSTFKSTDPHPPHTHANPPTFHIPHPHLTRGRENGFLAHEIYKVKWMRAIEPRACGVVRERESSEVDGEGRVR